LLFGSESKVILISQLRGFDAICDNSQRILSLFRMLAVSKLVPIACLSDAE